MHTPIHPLIVHFPLAMAFILPVLVLVFAYFIRVNKMTPSLWLVVVALQAFTTVMGYVALETGETEEHAVERVVSKNLIHEHEEAGEVFVGLTVVALAISIVAFFIRKEFQMYLQLGVALIVVVAAYFVFETGRLGGELVYRHGAASAYVQNSAGQEGILPTPGMNTSESPMPVNENESFKQDDSDYGNGNDDESVSDDHERQED